jgi:hypothetical protein
MLIRDLDSRMSDLGLAIDMLRRHAAP